VTKSASKTSSSPVAAASPIKSVSPVKSAPACSGDCSTTAAYHSSTDQPVSAVSATDAALDNGSVVCETVN